MRYCYGLCFFLLAFGVNAQTLDAYLSSPFERPLAELVKNVNNQDIEAVHRTASQWFRNQVSLSALRNSWPQEFKLGQATILNYSQSYGAAHTVVHMRYTDHETKGFGSVFYVIFWDLEPDGWHFNNLYLGAVKLPTRWPTALVEGFLKADRKIPPQEVLD